MGVGQPTGLSLYLSSLVGVVSLFVRFQLIAGFAYFRVTDHPSATDHPEGSRQTVSQTDPAASSAAVRTIRRKNTFDGSSPGRTR